MANTLGHFYKNFQGFTYCSVFKVLCCFATARLIYHSFALLSTAFLFLFSNTLRCLNGRFSSCSLPCLSRTRHILPPAPTKVNTFFHKIINCFNYTHNRQNGVIRSAIRHKANHSIHICYFFLTNPEIHAQTVAITAQPPIR